MHKDSKLNNIDTTQILTHFMEESIPGGLLAGYFETNFPLYFISDSLLKRLEYYSMEEFRENTHNLILNAIHPKDQLQLKNEINIGINNKGIFEFTFRLMKKNGQYMWFWGKGEATLDENNRTIVTCLCIDVNNQVLLQDKLKHQREITKDKIRELKLFNTIFPGGVFHIKNDCDFTLLYGNDIFYKIIGYSENQLEKQLENKTRRFIFPEDLATTQKLINDAICKSENTFIVEMRILTYTKDVRWVLASGNIVRENDEIIIYGLVIDVTDIKQSEIALKRNEECYQVALKDVKMGVWEFDLAHKKVNLLSSTKDNPAFSGILTNIPESLIETGYILPESVDEYLSMYKKLYQGESHATCTIKARSADGGYWWKKMTYTTLFDSDGNPIRAIGLAEDVSAQYEADYRYRQEVQYREAITLDMIASYRINLSSNFIEDIQTKNPIGIDVKNNESSYDALFAAGSKAIIHDEDRQRYLSKFNFESLLSSYNMGENSISLEYQRSNASGLIIWVVTTMNLMKEPQSGHLYGYLYIRNIDEKKKIELSLIARAERDSLTHLYNKSTTESMINKSLNHVNQTNRCALLMLDIDDFKIINDSHGHFYGDHILDETAKILISIFESQNIIGRIGGDEFIVFIESVQDNKVVEQKATAICEKLQELTDLDKGCRISGSIGIVYSQENKTDFNDLYKKADIALYDAKRKGKNQFSIFSVKAFQPEPINSDSICVAKDFFHTNCMMEELNIIAFVIDFDSYDILYLNRAARETFLKDNETANNQKCYRLIHGFNSPCSFCNKHNINSLNYDTWKCTNQKVHKRFLIKDKIITWREQRARLETFMDISYVHEQEDNMRVEVENILLDCTTVLLSSNQLDEAIQLVLERIGHFYHADRSYIIELDNKNRIGVNTFEWCNKDVKPKIKDNQAIPYDIIPRWLNAFNDGNAIILNSLDDIKETYPEEYAFLKDQDVDTLYVVSYSNEGNPIGYIGVDNPSYHLGDLSLIDSLSYFIMSETIKRKMRKKQEFLSYHDAMTGLLNRNCFTDYINNIREEALSSIGILSANINGLKNINQKYGHLYGDNLLIQVAEILNTNFTGAKIHRFAADEFIVIFEDITHEVFIKKVQETKEDFKTFLNDCVAVGYTWADKNIQIDQLLTHVDKLLLISKQDYYKRSHNDTIIGIEKMTDSLLENLDKKRFEMYLQPKCDIETDLIKGAEALVRFVHPKYGIISPTRFIPQLEENSLIYYLDFFMFEEVCKTLQAWKKKNYPLFCISVNVSRSTLLKPNLVKTFKNLADKYNVEHHLIEVEITESLGEMERETIAAISNQIRDENFRLSLDDFGAKYTSISILSFMNFDVLKLDKSLIDEIVSNHRSKVIVQRVLEICKDLNIHSIAEGVETIEQFAALKKLGCDSAQGYLFNKPIPINTFEEMYFSNK